MNLGAQSFDEALDRYRREWFQLTSSIGSSRSRRAPPSTPKLFETLREQVERYTNTFSTRSATYGRSRSMLSGHLDAVGTAAASILHRDSQSSRWWRGDGDKKAVVIISDALC